MDPIHQFEIKKLFVIGTIGGQEIAFTNSALFMLIIVLVASALLIGATSARALVPGRLQSVAEILYAFIANTLRSSAGTEGMKFFPFVFTLFMFVLIANMIGLIPYTFTVTSHIIITSALAGICVPRRPRIRVLAERAALLQFVRAKGRTDLHPTVDRVYRGAVISLAPDLS